MKYVIDPSEPFTGAVITQMSDDSHCDYYGKTIEELRIEQNNPRLTTITPEEVANLVNEHRRKLNTAPFVEIDEERYWDLLRMSASGSCPAKLLLCWRVLPV